MKHSPKFMGKHVLKSLFNKISGLQQATLLEKRLWDRCFPLNFAKSLQKIYFGEHLKATSFKLWAT